MKKTRIAYVLALLNVLVFAVPQAQAESAGSQALLLVGDRELGLPPVFNNKAWNMLEGAALSDPIFSFSTVDFALDVRDMPADFRKVVADSYFNVSSLNFTSGFQVASKIKLSGSMKKDIA